MTKHQSYYMVIPSEIWEATISAKAMIIYGHITVLANKKKYCFASNAYFASVMKCSPSSIKRALKELEDIGAISRELSYKNDSQEVEERKIFLNTGMVVNEPGPMVKNELTPMVTGDPDNNTSNNNTSINSKLDETSDKDFYGKIFFRIVDAYPKNRIGNRQHGLKKFKTLSREEAKLAAKNLKRYLTVSGEFVKSLQNYIEQACFSEEWLQAEEALKNKKQQTNKPDTKQFNKNYDNID